MTYVKLEDVVAMIARSGVTTISVAGLLTALRSLPTDDGWEEARRRFEYASRQYHNTQDWYGEESPEAGKSLHDWFMDALGPLPADDGWEDIATAPKDGTEVLLHFPMHGSSLSIGWFHLGEWLCAVDQCSWINEPTKWRPLPAPPAC